MLYSSSLRFLSRRSPHIVSKLANISAETPPSRAALLRLSICVEFKALLCHISPSQCGESFQSGRERHWSSADRNTCVLGLLQWYCRPARLIFSLLPVRTLPKINPLFWGSTFKKMAIFVEGNKKRRGKSVDGCAVRQ